MQFIKPDINLDIIGIADIDRDEIVWAWGLGVLDGQHQPTMTEQGTILVFDNGTARGYTKISWLKEKWSKGRLI